MALAALFAALGGVGAVMIAQPSSQGIWRRASSGAKLISGTFRDIPEGHDEQTAPRDDRPSPGFSRRIYGSAGLWRQELAETSGDLEIINGGYDLPARRFASVDEELAAYYEDGRGVALIEVSGIASEIRGDVIAVSTVTASVLEVVVNTEAQRLSPGATISFEIWGGKFEAHGKTAVVHPAGETLPAVGARYLWAFFDCAGASCSVGADFAAEVVGSKLRRLGRRNESVVDAQALPADYVIAAIRAKAPQRRVEK